MKTNNSPRQFLQFLAVSVALGMSAPALAALDEAQIEPFLKKEGCFKCHALDKTKKGPSYKKIAAKFKGKPDGEEKVIKNLTTSPKVKLEDGTEEDHKEISLKDPADLKAVAKWILSR